MADNHNPFDAEHLIGHVKDADYFEVPRAIAADGRLKIPQIRDTSQPIATIKVGFEPIDRLIEPLDFKITKFMVLEVVGAVIVSVLFIGLAQRVSTKGPTRGKFWNLLEVMLVFLRDQVVRLAIGHHDGDKFLPFVWTVFFFILICNLLGMVPWAGSPTGSLAVTGTMALITFGTVIGAGMMKMGPVGFWTGQVPHMDLPLPLAILLKPMIFAIEILGLCIKHFVLSVRLLANIMAGHLVLAVLIIFIRAIGLHVEASYHPLFLSVTIASIFAAVALSLLELFVAFLQAYIFAFLTSLFIGMAVHPH
jgi:F-type H+-transporting ATPase subunit a